MILVNYSSEFTFLFVVLATGFDWFNPSLIQNMNENEGSWESYDNINFKVFSGMDPRI